MPLLDKRLEELRGISYSDYIDIIRGKINNKSGYLSASYFLVLVKKNGKIIYPIKKEEIFPNVYEEYFSENLKIKRFDIDEIEEKYILVVLEKDTGETIEFIKRYGRGRKDIFDYGAQNRMKLPESIRLENKNIDAKLVELRPYYLNPNLHIRKLEKILDRKLNSFVDLPTILTIPLVLAYPQYFPKIEYMSKPYYQPYPYVFRDIYVTVGYGDTVIKVPIKIQYNLLSSLLLTRIVRSPTIEPFSLGLSYTFEFNKENLNYLDLEIPLDEVNYKINSAIRSLIHTISEIKFKPSDLGLYQITAENKGKYINIKFIDFASGLEIALTPNGVIKLILETIREIFNSDIHLLKKCRIENKKIICRHDIYNWEFNIWKILEPDISKALEIYEENGFSVRKSKEKIRRISDFFKEISNKIESIKYDEFELQRNVILETVRSYNRYIQKI